MQPGDRIGAYVLLEPLGHGAMGVVYRACDPRLDRTVALKVVNPTYAHGKGQAEARARLVEEARALARLSHPNVVPVFDVGVEDGAVYLAMELVDGIDLARWLKREKPSWRAVLDVFLDAARGLRCAHASGLVHRDFKPANVLLGSDGRARVVDFGLALAPCSPTIPDDIASFVSAGDAAGRLTGDGIVVGTPAYMAPEQHYGEPITAAADQYGFCVSLYEALYREHPFRARAWELVLAKRRGVKRPVSEAGIPRELFEIIARGLQHEPAQRFASMHELMRALDRVRRRRSRWVVSGIVATAGLGAALLPFVAISASSTCRSADRTAGVWNRGVAAELEQSFAATQLAYAPDTWARTEATLDEYFASWHAAYGESCRTQDEVALDRTMTCLEARLRDAEAVVEVLRSADAGVVGGASESTRRLASPASCLLPATDEPLPPDAAMQDAVQAIRDDLHRAATLQRAGRYAAAVELAREAVAAADATQFGAVQAEALEQLADAQEGAGEYEAARENSERAYFAATPIGHDVVASEAALGLAYLHGTRTYDFAEAERWGELARSSIERAGGDAPLAARLENTLGVIASHQNRSDEALAHYARALELVDEHNPMGFAALANAGVMHEEQDDHEAALAAYDAALVWAERELGAGHPKTGQIHDVKGNTLRHMGDLAAAAVEHELAVSTLERALGPSHTLLARPLTNLARTIEKQGELPRAMALYRRALDIEEANGDELIASLTLDDMGNALVNAGYFDAGRACLQRTLAIKETVYGPGHPETGYPLVGLAHLAMELGLHDEARVYYERALAAARARPEAATRVGAIALDGLGAVYDARHEHEEALAYRRQALAGFEAMGAEGSVDVAVTLFNSLDTLIALHRTDEAREAAERAVEILGTDLGWPDLRGDARIGLADLLWSRVEDRPRAWTLARLAALDFRAAGEGNDKAEAWLAAHRLSS